MRKETQFFLGTLSIFTISIYLLILLLNKYALLTFVHFLKACRQVSSNLLFSMVHHIGFLLIILTIFIAIVFFVKVIFSYIKTKRKLSELLQKKAPKDNLKLLKILKKNKIKKDKVILINSKSDIALTADWLKPKIIISTGLMGKLNKKELESVILHEYYHLQGRHPLIVVISEILSSSLFFIPIFKDYTRKMRITLEKEADNFATGKQQSAKHLKLALVKIKAQQKFDLFPNFSERSDYKPLKMNFAISGVTLIIGALLFLFPAQSHTVQITNNSNQTNCSKYQCSTHFNC